MTEAWSGIQLDAGLSTGNLKQIYPTWAPVGTNPATATPGQFVRQPIEGELISIGIETDNTNGGIVQIWDLSGADVGANVSSLDVITDAQLVTLQGLGKAKLIYEQNVVASGVTPPSGNYRRFMKGLAARFVGATGFCKLNLVVNGGFRLIHGSV